MDSLITIDDKIFKLSIEEDNNSLTAKKNKLQIMISYLKNCHVKRAVKLLDKGEDHQALKQLNLALKENPDNCFALNLLADLYHKHQNYRQASFVIDKALNIIGEEVFPGFYSTASRIYRQLGNKQLWISYALKEYNINSENRQALQEIIEYYYSQELYKEAAEYADKGIASFPENSFFYTFRGCIEMECSHFDSALSYFNKSLEKDPEYISTLAYLPAVMLRLGKTRNAVRAQVEVIRIQYEQESYDSYTSNVRQMLCDEAYDLYYEQIKKMTIKGRFKDRFMVELMRMCYYVKNYKEAAEWAHKSFMISHDYERLVNEAFLMYKAGEMQKSKNLLELVIQCEPQGTERLLDEVSQRVNSDTDSDFVFIICDTLEKICPEEGHTFYYRAYYNELLEQPLEAIRAFDKLLELWQADNAWAVLRRAIAYEQTGNHEKAVEGYKLIIDTPTMEGNFDELPLALLLLHGETALHNPLSNYRKGIETKQTILELLDQQIQLEQEKYDMLSDDIEGLSVLHLRRAACYCRIGKEEQALDDVRWILEHYAYPEFFLKHCFEIQQLRNSGAFEKLIEEFE